MKYRMTDDEHERLMNACKPAPYIVAGGLEPQSSRESAMRVWRDISARVGCDVDTIGPYGTDTHEFMAEPLAQKETT